MVLAPSLWACGEAEHYGWEGIAEQSQSPMVAGWRETGGRGQGQNISFKGIPKMTYFFQPGSTSA
jgi:hypothetical protein